MRHITLISKQCAFQVILWTDSKTMQMNKTYKFLPMVETRNLTRLIPQMVNSDIMAKLKNVGAVTDLMKYEVRLNQ